MSDEVRLPFRMNAKATYGTEAPREPVPQTLPPGWIRIPIRMQIRVSGEMADHLLRGGPPPRPGGEPEFGIVSNGLHLDPSRLRPGDPGAQEMQAMLDLLGDPAPEQDSEPDSEPSGPEHALPVLTVAA